MYSSSCPNESNCSLITKNESECFLGDFDEFLQNQQKFKSEDCLSVISNEFDQCPELDDYNSNDVEGDFEMINIDDKSLPSNYVTSEKRQHVRRGSEAMKELSCVILNKINRKFYSMRVGEWLKIKSKVDSKLPVYLLGKKYLFNNFNHSTIMGKKEFMLDFTSKFWFTYRQNFKSLPCSKSSNINVPEALRSSDCGWGCMLRSGQMIIAQALCMHFLGRDWRRTSVSLTEQALHRQIVKWFADTPKVSSPFSIHQILRVSDHNPGDWFGPFSICNALTKAFNESYQSEPKLRSIKIYFAQDRVIYRDEVYDLVKNEEYNLEANDSNHNSLIILIPLFFGSGSYCSPPFLSIISKWLNDSCCLGLIGGKPRHSIYAVGYQEKNVIYLDPHVLQDTVNVNKERFAVETFHCMQPLVMPFRYLDPNCAVGFYCRNLEEINVFLNRIQDISTVYTKSHKGWLSQPTIEVLSGYHEVFSDIDDPN